MGKTRETADLVSENNIFSNPATDRVGVRTSNPRFTLEVGPVGASGTTLHVNGSARITGILSVGQGTVSIDGNSDQINVGTGVNIHVTNGVTVGSNILNSSGLTLNNLNTSNLNVSGVVTATGGVTLGIQSGGTNITTGAVTALNFVGSGNSLSYNAGTKVVNISISGGGGGSNLIGTKTYATLTQLSSVTFTNTNYLTENYRFVTQLSDTQLMFAGFGNNTSNIRCVGQPFQIGSNGSITLGTQNSVSNTSGNQVSTTLYGEPHPGRAVFSSMSYFSGSTYVLSHWGIVCNSNNTCTPGVQNTGTQYTSAGYYWPNMGSIVGSTSGATNYAYYAGYTYFNNQYQTGFQRMAYNGSSHYTYDSYYDKGTASSTAGSFPALQHHSQALSPCGLVSWYSSSLSSPDYYGFSEIYGNTNTNIGNASVLFGDINIYYCNGFRMSDGKAVYIGYNGRYIVTNGSGTVLKSNATTVLPSSGFSYNYVNNTIIALGNNFFAAPMTGGWGIFKFSLDASNNLTITYSGGFTTLADPLLPNATSTSAGWRLAGANQQILVIASNGLITTYDFSPIKALMV